MDNSTYLALVRRLDDMERRIVSRLDALDSFKNKVVGGAIVVSAIISIMFEWFRT